MVERYLFMTSLCTSSRVLYKDSIASSNLECTLNYVNGVFESRSLKGSGEKTYNYIFCDDNDVIQESIIKFIYDITLRNSAWNDGDNIQIDNEISII